MNEVTMDRLNRIANGYVEAKILLAAAELRIFDMLTGDGATAADVSREAGGQVRGMEILLDALTAMEILDKDEETYRVREEYVPHLTEDSPTHYPALLRHRNLLFRSWAFLEERITGAAPQLPSFDRSVVTKSEPNENFIRAMFAVGHGNVAAVADLIDFSNVRKVVDLGGGPGHYLVEFIDRIDDPEPYLVDLPMTLDVASGILAESAHGDAIRMVPWDIYREDPPTELTDLDLVFVSQVFHAASPESNRALLGHLFPMMAPGGRVIVHENVVEPGRISPAEAALFAVNMLVMTEGGRTYTADEIIAWGTEAGFIAEPGVRLHERSYLVRLRRP